MSSVSKNFAYNLVLTLSTYVINLVITPYVTRVLGVEMIGRTGFVMQTVLYFSLFAVLGVATVGVREISACGNDFEKRSATFSSIFSLVMLTTLATLLVYISCIIFVPRFHADRELMIMGAVSLLFNTMLIEWFYQGMENFRYITIRKLAINILYAAAVLLLVHKPEDYHLYYFLTVAVVVVNALVNLLHSRKFVRFGVKRIDLKAFARPIFYLGLYGIMTAMYTTFNSMFLGFVHSDEIVGYYYLSTKIYAIILGVLTAFTTVMLPRMSALVAEHKEDEFRSNLNNSFDIVFTFSLPLIAGGIIMAPQIIRILSGPGYEGAILPMRLIMPVILITGCAQIWVTQTLMPLKKDKVLLVCAIIGAVVGVTANFLLVPSLGAVGSALVVLIAELVANSVSLTYAVRKGILVFPAARLLKYLVLSIPYFLICLLVSTFIDSYWLSFIVAVLACFAYFVIMNRWLVNDSVVSKFLAKWI